MHEMQTAVTDDRGVCLSVTQLNWASLYKNGQTGQDVVWGQQSWGPKEHCDRWGYSSPTGEGNWGKFCPFCTHYISVTAEARDLKFCMRTEGLGP